MHPLAQFSFCPKCGSKKFVIHDDKSKRCEDCGFIYYLNPSAAVVCVLLDRENLLVVRRANDPAKGTLDLPGGFVDMDETSEEAVRREVFEETHLQVTETEFLFSLPNNYFYSDFNVPTLDLFYACKVASLEPMKANDDVSECFFVPICEIDETKFGLSSIRESIPMIKKWYEKERKNKLF